MGLSRQHWDRFLAALAEPDQPHAAFKAIEAITKETVGTILFTTMTFDVSTGLARRVYSDNETAYPTCGYKPISAGKWSEIVLEGHQPFSSLTIEEIAEVFSDWPLIQSLGCESGCNIPVVVAGSVIGTINLMDKKGHYTPERVAQAMELRPMAAIAFLAASKFERSANPAEG